MVISMVKYNNSIIMKKIITLLAFIPLLFGCRDMFEPAIENYRELEALYSEPALAQGLLGHAYIGNPLGSWSFSDVATDDAVSNDIGNGYRRIATGQWRANSSPMNGNWQNRRASLQYINLFISIIDSVKWANDAKVAEMFRDRMTGDAYGMRALYHYHLLLEHAGWTASGELLGIPILTEPEDQYSNFNRPRNTFKECMQQIYDDVKVAQDNLPLFYGNMDDDKNVPGKYRNRPDTIRASDYTRVFGNKTLNRMSALVAEAVRAQATLLAASPAYSDGSGYTYADAAHQFAIVLKDGLGSSPVNQIDPTGHNWFEQRTFLNSFTAGQNAKEMLWRGNVDNNTGLAPDHYPPTIAGRGRLNPTQNLVDAFPMANGYPINNPSSGYDPANPYTGRDPRLDLYIIYNGRPAGNSNTPIYTAEDGTNNDALNKVETSTRTGYYMRKLIRHDTRILNGTTNQRNYKAFIRYTELFLGYAEAANEAWGPTGIDTVGYSAYDVIKAIRTRAGITGGDSYLEDCKASKELMRELIRNERRLELCFEGHRFWDLRRWQVPIAEQAKGMRITGTGTGTYTYTPFVVEERSYLDYMYHAPVPYSEVLKFNALVQNKGW